MVKIFDNFLDNETFNNIKNYILNDEDFPWFYCQGKSSPTESSYQFVHIFYSNDTINSRHFEILKPIFQKLEVQSLLRVKLNFSPKSDQFKTFDFHRDVEAMCKTSIFYLNTNNGKTVFENGDEVESRENRLITFPAHTNHTGTTHTDTDYRLVLNINHF